jgi:hypothetical protein
MNPMKHFAASLLLAGFAMAHSAFAGIISHHTSLASFDASAEITATLTFTGLPNGTLLSNQYAGLGVTFTEGVDEVYTHPNFLTDLWGIDGIETITMQFAAPITGIGVDFPGALTIDLYLGSALVGTSNNFGESGLGFFGGVIATPFDRAVLRDWAEMNVFVDNIYLARAVAVPEPSSVALVLGGMLLFGLALRVRRTDS